MGVRTKEIQTCDLCGNDVTFTNHCPFCGRDVCLVICSGVLYDTFHTDLCKECVKNPDIETLFVSWHKHWLNDRAVFLAEIKRRKNQNATKS